MSQTVATVANPRPPRPHRGSWKGGPNSHPRSNNPNNAFSPSSQSGPAPPVEEPEEIRVLKGKHGVALKTVKEIYPDWTDEDVLDLLEEVQGDVSIAVARISEGHAERWSSQTRKKKVAHPTATVAKGKGTPEGGLNGHALAGGRGIRGGRGGGRGGFTGVARGGRGGFAGGRGGARKRDVDGVAAPDAATPPVESGGVTEGNGWGAPADGDAPAPENVAPGWGAAADSAVAVPEWEDPKGQKNNIAAWAKGGDKTGWEDSHGAKGGPPTLLHQLDVSKKPEPRFGAKSAVTAALTTAAEAGTPRTETPAANGLIAPAPQKSSKVPAAPKLSWAQIAKPQPKPTPPPPPPAAAIAPPPLPTPPISDEVPHIPISSNPPLDEPEEPTTISTEPAWALAEPATTMDEPQYGSDAGDEENLGGEPWEEVEKVLETEPEPVTTVADLNEQEPPAAIFQQASAPEAPKAKLPISPGISGATPPGLSGPVVTSAKTSKPALHPRSSSARFKIGDNAPVAGAARWGTSGLNMMFGSLKLGDDTEEGTEDGPVPSDQRAAAEPASAPAPAPQTYAPPASVSAPENLANLSASQSQPLPPKPEVPQPSVYQTQQHTAPPQSASLAPAAPQPTASAAAGLSNVQHLYNASLSHAPPASAPLAGSLQSQQAQQPQYLTSIPSQPPHLQQQQHTPTYQPQQQQAPQQPSYLSGLQQQGLSGLPSHLDAHSPLPPSQAQQHPQQQQQQQHTQSLGQQQPTSSLGQNYFRQEQQQQYYHAPTPPQTGQTQQDHLPSTYGNFGGLGQTGQGGLQGFGASGGLGNDYGYASNERNFYDPYNQNNFRGAGHDDHKLPSQPSQPSLQSQQPVQSQAQTAPQSHLGQGAPSQQPGAQTQPGQAQQPQQHQQFPGMAPPVPSYYYPPYYNQYYGQPTPQYGQPFIQYPKYGVPPAQAPASKPAAAQNTTAPFANNQLGYHPNQSGGLAGYDDPTPTAYGGASNSLDYKYTQGLQNFLGVPGSNSSLLGGVAGGANQQRGGNAGSAAGALQDRYTASQQQAEKPQPTPSQIPQLGGQGARPGAGAAQASQGQQQPHQGASQQQGGGYYGNRYGNAAQPQGQAAYPPQGGDQFYQQYNQRQYWQQ